jgi:preprotein translocase subunit SecA
MRRTVFQDEIHSVMGEKGYLEDRQELETILKTMEGLYFPKGAYAPSDQELSSITAESLLDKVMELSDQVYAAKEQVYGSPLMREAERVITLRVVDEYWMDQIDAMQDLRQGIGLRSYGQNDPLVEYKREGYDMFVAMNRAIQEETTRRLFLFRIQKNEPLKREKVAKVTSAGAGDDKSVRKEPLKKKVKVGRNDPCPCGSGKKYKNCCLDKDMAAGKNIES